MKSIELLLIKSLILFMSDIPPPKITGISTSLATLPENQPAYPDCSGLSRNTVVRETW